MINLKVMFIQDNILMGKDTAMVVFKYPNGNKYEGNFRNDKREGEGTYYFASGNKHVGRL